MPRRFDIPGDLDGIAFRLNSPDDYLHGPACVIGGGTSAAEAVIGISEVKAKQKGSGSVYWSYRGESMPKVSKALSDVFFQAYLGNGNIRYLPNSDPVAISTDADGESYLCLRTDRKVLVDRPCETTHLEFPKRNCLACIGEDLPTQMLRSMGITLVEGGPKMKKRMVVTPLLESCQPNVYLIGDLLSPMYLQTEDFAADPSTFTDIKRRGNIKAALRDGVFVVEVIAQKLANKSVVNVDLDFESPHVAPQPEPPTADVTPEAPQPPTSPVPPQPAVSTASNATAGDAHLVRILPGDVAAEEFPLPPGATTTIGRMACAISFPDDTKLSDRHASVERGPDGFLVRDDGSAGGVFIRLRPGGEVAIDPGATIKIGAQWLRFSTSQAGFQMTHYDATGAVKSSHQLTERTVVAGRDAPGITLDPEDGTLSRRHVSLAVEDGVLNLRDLNSVNGTYLLVQTPTSLSEGDDLYVGQERLRLIVNAPPSPPERR